ncbi:transcriptional activator NhaR [Caenimonas terrae]|uniref:Transcriptional activator NhaR n=1 Tax=Caenimonas terrae TaxID=696074 RepID=A0ABW0NGF4_9BURK
MNYKHLHYFWTVVHAGGVAKASERLHLTPQTLSGQIKALEGRLGRPLLRKAGRGVEPTEAGRLVLRYADEIFALGTALQEALHSGREGPWQSTFRVGIVDSVPKAVAYKVLEPSLAATPQARLVCHEGKLTALLAELAVHRLDLIVSDVPLPAGVSIKAFTHLLGSSAISFFAAPALLRRCGLSLRQARARFPACLAQLPLLLPGQDCAVRPRLDAWLREQGLMPRVAAEFDDSALAKAFGREGLGVIAGPAVLEGEIARQYQVDRLGAASDLLEEFYVLSVERRLTHPGVLAITQAARRDLFR